jgi:hypothetical protein
MKKEAKEIFIPSVPFFERDATCYVLRPTYFTGCLTTLITFNSAADQEWNSLFEDIARDNNMPLVALTLPEALELATRWVDLAKADYRRAADKQPEQDTALDFTGKGTITCGIACVTDIAEMSGSETHTVMSFA